MLFIRTTNSYLRLSVHKCNKYITCCDKHITCELREKIAQAGSPFANNAQLRIGIWPSMHRRSAISCGRCQAGRVQSFCFTALPERLIKKVLITQCTMVKTRLITCGLVANKCATERGRSKTKA